MHCECCGYEGCSPTCPNDQVVRYPNRKTWADVENAPD
jgi:hypothetical protein